MRSLGRPISTKVRFESSSPVFRSEAKPPERISLRLPLAEAPHMGPDRTLAGLQACRSIVDSDPTR
jgi:hypothetical protein